MLLPRYPLAGEEPPVYAVDVSVWPRCDAEASPERGFYYHPSRSTVGYPVNAASRAVNQRLAVFFESFRRSW